MKSIYLVIIGLTSSIFCGVSLLPSAHAQCTLTADPCSTEAGSEECCFPSQGAVCDTISGGGTCCFPTKDDETAVCTQNNDCCGGLLCIAGVCSDTIAFEIEGVVLTIVIAETEYGSGEEVVSTITAQEEGNDEFVFALDPDGEVANVTSNGETFFPDEANGTSSENTFFPDPESSPRRLQLNDGGVVTTVGSTHPNGFELSKRHLSKESVDACEQVATLICNLGLSVLCTSDTGPLVPICDALKDVCGTGTDSIEDVCESIVDCTGDPHMRGLQGQKFDFSGKDGAWYSILHDASFYVNMRVTAPIPGLEDITYITGLAISIISDNRERHTIVLTVDNPLEMQSECPDMGLTCLADGALTVELDGVRLAHPGEVDLGGGVFFAAANIPGECRPFGFEQYWQKKAAVRASLAASGQRRLELSPTALWILADEHKTNPAECRAYVKSAMAGGTLFDHQSEHTSIQITAPDVSIRVNHGKIHQLAMRDPTDQFDLPDHIAYQMNLAFERLSIGEYPQGVIGATAHITRDEHGESIMNGPGAFPGEEEDYRVSGHLNPGWTTVIY